MSRNDCKHTDDRQAIETQHLLYSTEYAGQVLGVLSESSEQEVRLMELIEECCQADSGPADTERVAIQLHHATLPKLDEAGIFEYDWRRGAVRYSGRPSVDAHLDVATGTED